MNRTIKGILQMWPSLAKNYSTMNLKNDISNISHVILTDEYMKRVIDKMNKSIVFKGVNELKKKASVLISLCHKDEEICLLYTVRSDYVTTDKRHISFPGGKTKVGEHAEDAAVREANEEIGISINDIKIYGSISSVKFRDIMLTPVVGYIGKIEDPSKLAIDVGEVKLVFTVPLWILCDRNNFHYTQFRNPDRSLPVFMVGEYKIWGLTAWITHSFLQYYLPKHYKHKVPFIKLFGET